MQVKCLWNITPAQESLITSIVFCGTMIGAYSWGVLGDAKGRRVGFFATAMFTFVFGVLSAASPNYVVRTPSRAVQHMGTCFLRSCTYHMRAKAHAIVVCLHTTLHVLGQLTACLNKDIDSNWPRLCQRHAS